MAFPDEHGKVYVSHGAGSTHDGKYEPDWFVIEGPSGMLARQVASLRDNGRTVIEIDAVPWNGERIELV